VSFTKGPTQIVGGFARLYEECYNNYITENGLNEEELTLNEFLAEHLNSGEFYHKKDQPFLEFLSSLSDIVVIPSVIKMCTGYDFITKEDLTSDEISMLGITTIINVFSIASAIYTAGGSLSTSQILKTVLIEMAADVTATTIVYVGDEIGLPKPISMLFALGGGIAVGKLGTKYFITTNDKIIAEVSEETVERLAKETGGDLDVVLKNVDKVGDSEFVGPLNAQQNHFINGDGIGQKQKGVLGAHNMESFNKTLASTGFSPEDLKIGEPVPHQTIEGIYSQKYTVPAYDAQGKHIGFKNIMDPKTIYDPKVISDSQMLEWGTEAMENGVITGRIINGVASNGLGFRGYLEDGIVVSFFPIIQ